MNLNSSSLKLAGITHHIGHQSIGVKCIWIFIQRQYHKKLANSTIQQRRIAIFDKEVKRQNSLITDIEKIQVKYIGLPEEMTLIMNKHISTPYNCAQHINNRVLKESVIAEVDGETWDMFRPLTHDCTLKYLHFRDPDPFYVNKAFWRSLSLMLGFVLETTFHDDINVQLCSFPAPQVRSGSFVYDAEIGIDSWKPAAEELRILSSEMVKLALANHPFQRLVVDANVALRLFEDNYFKKAQIPDIASKSKSGNDIVLYRVGNFIDISRGPAISHTGHMGKCTIAAVIPITTDPVNLYRVQGVALPYGFKMNHYTYCLLEGRARKLNNGRLPHIAGTENENIQSKTESTVQLNE